MPRAQKKDKTKISRNNMKIREEIKCKFKKYKTGLLLWCSGLAGSSSAGYSTFSPLPWNGPGEAVQGSPSTWTPSTMTPRVLVIVIIWGVTTGWKSSFSLVLLLCHSAFEIRKSYVYTQRR